jgi:type IV secretory pathway component VirB8
MLEPSRLLSRVMAFTLAGLAAALAALIAALSGMFPLERTQVFFLSTRPESAQIINITKFDMAVENLDAYKESFIKEYITARNQIVPDYPLMRRKWRADGGGLVFNYSDMDVYRGFMKTDMWHAIMEGKYEPFSFRCDVSFDKIVPRERGGEIEKFAARFRYICSDKSTGQGAPKDFTIRLGLRFQTELNYGERFDNPLGLKVVEYIVEDGGGDPLNWL